ncbi:MAG: hypothetical protein HOP23_14055 [Methylococcaceae bacterium]|nr:hypothetical protein [Methylococcaceae bacterium]
MRIHSSSLTLAPANFNQQPVGKQPGTLNNNEKKDQRPVTETLATNQSHFANYTPDEIIEPSRLNLSLINNAGTDSPLDTRTLKALNAYHQEFNKPLLDQRARAFKGIDIYA